MAVFLIYGCVFLAMFFFPAMVVSLSYGCVFSYGCVLSYGCVFSYGCVLAGAILRVKQD